MMKMMRKEVIKIIGFIKKMINKNIPKPFGQTAWDPYRVNYDLFVTQAYENPFIQAVFNEFVTDLKSIKFEVQTKDGKLSKTQGANLVTNTINRPHKELSYSDFIEAVATYLIFGGRCLLYKSRGILSKNLYVYSPNSFTIRRNETTLEMEAILLGDREIKGADLKSFQLVKNFDPSDSIAGFGGGYSKIKPLAMVGDMLNYLLEHNNSLLKNGGNVGGILSIPSDADKEDMAEIRNHVKKQAGRRNAGDFITLRGAYTFTPTNTPPKELDWVLGMIELQKIICRVLGIPETLIMAENSSYNNLEGYKKKVYQDTIIPFANKIAEELTQLFIDDLDPGEKVVVNTANIKALQTDVAKQIGEYAKALDGKITTNDFIKFINKAYDLAIPNLKGEEGNRVLVSSNMMFLDELGVDYDPTPEEDNSQQDKNIDPKGNKKKLQDNTNSIS